MAKFREPSEPPDVELLEAAAEEQLGAEFVRRVQVAAIVGGWSLDAYVGRLQNLDALVEEVALLDAAEPEVSAFDVLAAEEFLDTLSMHTDLEYREERSSYISTYGTEPDENGRPAWRAHFFARDLDPEEPEAEADE